MIQPRPRCEFATVLAALAITSALGFFAPRVLATPDVYVGMNAPSAGNGSIAVIDAGTNQVVTTTTVGPAPSAVAVSPDGSRVYVTNAGNGTVSVIDTASDQVLATFTVGGSPTGVAVSPVGSRAYVVGSGGVQLSVIDTDDDQVLGTVSVCSSPDAVTVGPGGRRVYVGCGAGDTIAVIDAATDQVVTTIADPGGPYQLLVSPDGTRLYASNFNGTVSVIDTDDDQVVTTISVAKTVAGLALDATGGVLYVADAAAGAVSVIDTDDDQVVTTITVGSNPQGLSLSPDGTRLYVLNQGSGTVSVIDTSGDQVVTTVSLPATPSTLGTFVGEGALVAANAVATTSVGTQLSGVVPTLTNSSGCTTADEVVAPPAVGTLSFDDSTGAFVYTPPSSTYSGPATFLWEGVASSTCTAAEDPVDPVSDVATEAITVEPAIAGLTNSLTIEPGQDAQETFTLVGSPPFTAVGATSADTAVVPSSGLALTPADCGATGALTCTLSIQAGSATGASNVTVTATDTHGDTVTQTVAVSVTSPPTITGLEALSIPESGRASETIELAGPGTLTLTATSSDPSLMPVSGIGFGPSCDRAGSCVLTLTPVAGRTGTATVTLTLTDDEGGRASGSFAVVVNTPPPTGTGSGGGGGGAPSPALLVLLGVFALVLAAKRRTSPDGSTVGSSAGI